MIAPAAMGAITPETVEMTNVRRNVPTNSLRNHVRLLRSCSNACPLSTMESYPGC